PWRFSLPPGKGVANLYALVRPAGSRNTPSIDRFVVDLMKPAHLSALADDGGFTPLALDPADTLSDSAQYIKAILTSRAESLYIVDGNGLENEAETKEDRERIIGSGDGIPKYLLNTGVA